MSLPAAFTLARLDETPSTNAEALRLAERGADDLTLVWARTQSSGRGRLGRAWVSPPGNLYCSLVLRLDPDGPPPATLSLVAALAAAEAAESLLPGLARAEVKWVNDVMIGGRKVSGSLAERGAGDALVLGIGINVAHAPDLTGGPYEATSLAACGAEAGVEEALAALGHRLLSRLTTWRAGGFAPLRAPYEERMWRLGLPIRVGLDAERRTTAKGTNGGVDEDGRLRLELPDGRTRLLHAGDVLAGRG